MSKLPSALAFASRGHAVVPLYWPVLIDGRLVCSCKKRRDCPSPAKHPYAPLAPNGILSGTVETGIIKNWWRQAPEAGLAIRTDKLVVLDIDPRHGGDESLRTLEAEYGPLPLTWRVLTGGGGEHIPFAAPEGGIRSWSHPAAPLGAGVDGRGLAAYVVAPPSIHVSGRPYAWSVDHHPNDVPLAVPPQWLLDKLAPQARRKSPADWDRTFTGPIKEYRDTAARQTAGLALRLIRDKRRAWHFVRAWSEAACEPPLSDDELLAIFNRIADRHANREDGA